MDKIRFVAGHQSHYLPWIGYISKIYQADIFCIVDSIQYEKKNYQNRNTIKTSAGPVLLTVPVKTHERFTQRIMDVEIDNRQPWQRKHWKTIVSAYRPAPYFDKYADFFEDVYRREWSKLSDLNDYMLHGILEFIGIDRPVVKSSTFMPEGQKTDLLIDICRKTGAQGYLSGTGAAHGYVDESKFQAAGLLHKFQTFHHPTYRQLWGPFVSHMAVIDLLFNCGGEESLRVIEESSRA